MAEQYDKKERGLEPRYRVEKINDPDGKHPDCWYFVLDPQHDTFAVDALRAYAAASARANPQLANDIGEWLRGLGFCPRCRQVTGHRGPCASSLSPEPLGDGFPSGRSAQGAEHPSPSCTTPSVQEARGE